MRTCRVEGCTRTLKSLGLCGTHYERKRRHGTLELRPAGRPIGARRLSRGNPPYYFVRVPDHPLVTPRSDGWVGEHRLLLFAATGPELAHPCWRCGRVVEWGGTGHRRLVVDHVDGVSLRNVVSNLRVSCAPCNLKRPTPRRCAFCAGSLTGRRSDARFCSAACRRRAARCEPVTDEVKICKGPSCDRPLDGKRSTARYCSERCRSRARRPAFAVAVRCAVRTPPNAAAGPPACCERPLPTQRGNQPWRCASCGSDVPAPFEVPG